MLRFKYRYIFIFTLLLILLINIFLKSVHNCLSFLPYGISESSYVTLASEKSFCVGSKDIINFQTNDKGARILKNENFIKKLKIFGDSQAVGLEVNNTNEYFLTKKFSDTNFEIYAAPNNGPYESLNRIQNLNFENDELIVFNFNLSVDLYRLNNWNPKNFVSLNESNLEIIHKYPFLNEIFIFYSLIFNNNFTLIRNNTDKMQDIFIEEDLNLIRYYLINFFDDFSYLLNKKNIKALVIFSTPYWLYTYSDSNNLKATNEILIKKFQDLEKILINIGDDKQYKNIQFAKTVYSKHLELKNITSDKRHIKHLSLNDIKVLH